MNPTQRIDDQIASYPDWRGQVMAKLRQLIHQADPHIIEEWKWETGIWSHGGMVCAVSAFKNHVKINFFKGSVLLDPNHLLNSGLDSKHHRAIDIKEGDVINDKGIVALLKAAVALNNPKK